jgi:hypothetical protein
VLQLHGRITKKWKQVYAQDRDLKKDFTNCLVTADQWSKQIVTLTLDFVLDALYCCNKVEHEQDKNNIPMVKERLLAKREWIKTGMTSSDLRHYKNQKIDELKKTGIPNLEMLAEQLSMLRRIRKESTNTAEETSMEGE